MAKEKTEKPLDYNKRAAVGQAYNLAVADSIKNGKENNPQYIYKKFVYYQKLGEALQSSDTELIYEVLANKKLEKLLKELEEVLK